MNLKRAYSLTKEFSSNSYHHGKLIYTPSITDIITFSQKQGNETTIYLTMTNTDNESFKMRFGDISDFTNKIMNKTIRPDGKIIPDKIYTSHGFVDISEFQEALDKINNLPRVIDYNIFEGDSIPTRSLFDGVYFLETGEIIFQFKRNKRIPFMNESSYIQSNQIGKRMLVKVFLNEDYKFEAVDLPRLKKTEDKILAVYPDYDLTDDIEKFILKNNKD